MALALICWKIPLMATRQALTAARQDAPCPPAAPAFGDDSSWHQPMALWRSRGIGDWLIMLTVTGRARIGFAGGEILVGADDWVLIAPGAPHDYGTAPSDRPHWRVRWLVFQPTADWLDLLRWDEDAPGIMHLSAGPADRLSKAATALDEAIQLARAGPGRERLLRNRIEACLLWCQAARQDQPLGDPRVQRVADRWSSEPAAGTDLAAAAALAGVSIPQLVRLFRRHTGRSPREFAEDVRLDRARQLLLAGYTAVAAGLQCGFADGAHFGRRFRERYGTTPGAFRSARGTRR
ncbi:AraC family transcriptional regulator [Planctomycetota bacterium]|nr:AraC family transcriptional regulator [Planctomycetota bacterium]